MKRLALLALLAAGAAFAQPPGGGPPPGGPGGQGGPPRFELGRVLPPHVRQQIELTKDQEKEIAELEKLVKEKLDKILTAEQKKAVEKAGPPQGGPGGGGPGGPGGGPGGDRKPPAEKPKKEEKKADAGGIQWFTSLEAGRAEATKTGRPILLISGTPHCGGVSGIW